MKTERIKKRPDNLPADMAWCGKAYNDDDDMHHYVYDGSMSVNDAYLMHTQMEQDQEPKAEDTSLRSYLNHMEISITDREETSVQWIDNCKESTIQDVISIAEKIREYEEEKVLKEILETFEDLCDAMQRKSDILSTPGWNEWQAPGCPMDQEYIAADRQTIQASRAIQDLLGDDVKPIRIKNNIYLKIGEVIE